MKYAKAFLILLSGAFFIDSCGKSYLEKRPLGQLDETAIANKKGVEGLLIAAYSLLDGIGSTKSGWFSAGSNWIYGSICGSEAYTGSDDIDDGRRIPLTLEKFAPTSSNDAIVSKWGTVYDGVQRANEVLRIMAKAKDILPQIKNVFQQKPVSFVPGIILKQRKCGTTCLLLMKQ